MSKTVSRRFLYAPLAAAGVLLAVWGGVWLRGAAKMEDAVTAWAEDRRADGIAVAYRKFSARGFPFYLRGRLDAAEIAGDGFSWRAERLHLDALPQNLGRIVLSAAGAQTLDLGGESYAISAPQGRASIARDASRGWILDVQTGPFLARSQEGWSIAAQEILLTAAPDPAERQRIEASLAATTVRAGEADAFDLAFSAMVSRAAMLARAGDWLAAGGEAEIRRLDVKTAAASASLAGRIARKTNGAPEGALEADIVNPGALALLLGEAGALRKDRARAAAAALSIAALAQGGRIKGAVEIEEGAVRIGGVELAHGQP